MSNGFFTSGMAGTTPNFNPVPSVLTPTMSPAPVDTTFQSQVAAPALIPQQSGGFLSSAFDFLGSDVFNQALRTGGQYYLGQENIKGAQQLGRESQAGAQALAQEARAGTEFKPYTVTSGLANVATDPTGGLCCKSITRTTSSTGAATGPSRRFVWSGRCRPCYSTSCSL